MVVTVMEMMAAAEVACEPLTVLVANLTLLTMVLSRCDTAWVEFGISCAQLEANYSWDCSGCNCPGDVADVNNDEFSYESYPEIQVYEDIESDRLMLEDFMNKVSSINSINNTKEYYSVIQSSRELLGYNVYRDGGFLAEVNGGQTSYDDFSAQLVLNIVTQ